eukprot:COSAG01_NODE_3506_length_5991_cov_16.426680_7_plen_65_part_00
MHEQAAIAVGLTTAEDMEEAGMYMDGERRLELLPESRGKLAVTDAEWALTEAVVAWARRLTQLP